MEEHITRMERLVERYERDQRYWHLWIHEASEWFACGAELSRERDAYWDSIPEWEAGLDHASEMEAKAQRIVEMYQARCDRYLKLSQAIGRALDLVAAAS